MSGLDRLFKSNKLFIIKREKVVLPTPNSPFNKSTSPTLIFFEKFVARDSILEISKILFSRVSKSYYVIPLRVSTKSVFSQVKCPSLVGVLPKWP